MTEFNTFKNYVSPETAKSIITTSVKYLLENPNLADKIPAILLRGNPGVGKSTIVRDVAKNLNIGFKDIRLAQMDRVDLCGVPSVNDNKTQWNIPSVWPDMDDKQGGIILFDEITSAPADVQVAAYSMILDRRIPNTNYALPKTWFIVAAGNTTTDRAVVRSMSSALANRFAHLDVSTSVEDFISYGIENHFNPAILGFVQFRPDKLLDMNTENSNLEAGWPSPRSWERVSTTLSIFENANEDITRNVVYSLIGTNTGLEFMEFLKISKNNASVLEMLDGKIPVSIPTKIDEKYAFYTAISYLVFDVKTKAEIDKRLSVVFKILDKSENDYATMLLKMITGGNQKFSKKDILLMLIKNKEYKNYAKKHSEMLNNAKVVNLDI